MTNITTIATILKLVEFLYRLLIVNSNTCWSSLTIIVRPIQIFSIATLKDQKITKLPLHFKKPANYNKNSILHLPNKTNLLSKRKGKSDKNDNVQEIKILNATIKLKKVVKSNLFESYLSSFCIYFSLFLNLPIFITKKKYDFLFKNLISWEIRCKSRLIKI